MKMLTAEQLVIEYVKTLTERIQADEAEADELEARAAVLRDRVETVEQHIRRLSGEIVGTTSDGVDILRPHGAN